MALPLDTTAGFVCSHPLVDVAQALNRDLWLFAAWQGSREHLRLLFPSYELLGLCNLIFVKYLLLNPVSPPPPPNLLKIFAQIHWQPMENHKGLLVSFLLGLFKGHFTYKILP